MQGDITGMSADALVHPTNSSLAMMGEVGQALERKGGKEFLQVSALFKYLLTKKIGVTPLFLKTIFNVFFCHM